VNKILLATIVFMVTFINISFAVTCDVNIWKSKSSWFHSGEGKFNAVKSTDSNVASEDVHNATASELAQELGVTEEFVAQEAAKDSINNKVTIPYAKCAEKAFPPK